MTVKELVSVLKSAPEDADVLYLHNEHGRISVDVVEIKEEKTISDKLFCTVTLSGNGKED